MSTSPVLHQQSAPAALTESEWGDLERTANRLAAISWIPQAYQRKPADIMAAGLALSSIGRPLTPMTLKLVYIVNGTADFMVDLISAQVHEHGHEMWVVESTPEYATVAGQRRGSDRVHEATFTLEQAKAAGLAGKDNWKKWQQDMLVARAAKRVAKRVCPEAMLGMPPPLQFAYTESGRIQVAPIVPEVDDDGVIVDGELVEDTDARPPPFTAADEKLIDAETRRVFARQVKDAGFDEAALEAIVHRATKGRTSAVGAVLKDELNRLEVVLGALVEGKLAESVIDGVVRLVVVEDEPVPAA
ncbi:MAG: hypothetical protein LC798_20170 [Chloroflexi bacterium]|nr:hypothetical protein [Chloroflexota bacterium]